MLFGLINTTAIQEWFKCYFKEPEDIVETESKNTVYNVKDVFIDGNGFFIVLYFNNNEICTLVENLNGFRGDIVTIKCFRVKGETTLLKHTTTITKTLVTFQGIQIIRKEYELYLPDIITVKGAINTQN